MGPADAVQAAMEERCKSPHKSDIFKVVTMIDMKWIKRLEIHQGKDPSVELKVDASGLVEKDEA